MILLKNKKKNVFFLLDLLRPLAFQDRIFIFKTRTYSLEHPKEMKLCIIGYTHMWARPLKCK